MSARGHRRRRHRARVAPRPQGRRESRIRWDRLGRIVLVLVLLAVMAMYARPVLSVADSWRDTQAEDQRLEDVKRENRRLQKRHDQLNGGAKRSQTGGKIATPPSGGVELTLPGESETGAVSGAAAEAAVEPDPAPAEPGAVVETDAAPAQDAGGAAPGGGASGGTSTGAVPG